jgi:hypothetical protein
VQPPHALPTYMGRIMRFHLERGLRRAHRVAIPQVATLSGLAVPRLIKGASQARSSIQFCYVITS